MLVDESLPLYESAIGKLGALQPPKRDETAVRAWLAADRRVAANMRALGRAALRRDYPSVVGAASSVRSATAAARTAAATLGLHVCARS